MNMFIIRISLKARIALVKTSKDGMVSIKDRSKNEVC